MPCLFGLLALLTPRLVIAGLWLLTGWFPRLFSTPVWPALGFLFAPSTLLWYSVVQHWFGGRWDTPQWIGLAIALLLDGVPAKLRLGRRR